MNVSSCSSSVAPPKTPMMTRLAHCIFETLWRRQSDQPMRSAVAAMATAVATKMSVNLNATKKRMTGKRSKRNFTNPRASRLTHYYCRKTASGTRMAFLDEAPHGRGHPRREGERERFAVEARALVRQRAIERVERLLDQAGVFRADRGDREVDVQDPPRPLGIGALQVGGEARPQVRGEELHHAEDRRELRLAARRVRPHGERVHHGLGHRELDTVPDGP